jgi:hypothetical protein
MQSKKSVKSEEESSAKRIPVTSDYVGLKETCPFQDQSVIEVHCRSDCAWYSHDACIIWDITAALRRLASDKTVEGTLKFQR